MKPSRYPSLQIPASTPADLRAFLEGVKERLEITTGDRGDPRDRLLTVRDVEAAGMATVTVRNKFATLSGGASAKSVEALISDSGTTGTFDGILAPSLEILTELQVVDATDFITYNNTVARLQRVPYQTLRALFLHEDSDAELAGNWQFQNEELALEISAEVPRFRFTESSSTEVLPTDGNVWDWTVDDQLMSLFLVSDDEADSTSMLELGRDGLDPSFFALVNGTILQIQDGTLADPGLVFDDDINTGLYRIGADRFGLSAGGVLALDVQGTQLGIPNGTAGLPAAAFQSDTDTGLFRAAANELGFSTGGTERLRVNSTGLTVAGTAVLTASTGHLDVTPSSAADFAALKVRNSVGTEIWRLNSETDGDLDFARQSGTGLLRLNGVALIDAGLFTTGTLDDARLSANVPLKNTANVFTAANTFNLTPTVPDASWTYAKLQNVSATSRVLGRITAGAGVIEELTGANVGTIIGYTAADVLAKLLTVDGAGSGLDADLLDGNSSAAFLQTATYEALTPVWANPHTFSSATHHMLTVAEVAGVTGLAQATTSLYSGARLLTVRAANSPTNRLVRINTSLAAPSAIQNGDSVGIYEFGGYDGTTVQNSHGRVEATALEDWTGSARGCSVTLKGTPAGTTTLTDGLRITGTTTIAAQFADGVVGQPSIGFYNAAGTGIYRTGGGSLAVSIAGTLTAAFNANGQNTLLDGTAALPAVSFISDPDTGFYRIAANNVGIAVNGTNVLDLAASVSKLHEASESLQLVIGSTTGIGSFAGINGIILAASSTSQVRIYARAAAAGLNAYRINGTSGSPTAVVSGNNIFAFNALGATDTTPTLSSGASLQMTATENWSSTNRGCRINFNTTATGSTVATTTCIYLGNQAQFLDATAAAPAVSFQNDLDCGLYRIGANQLGIATNGTLVLDISTGTFAVTATTVRLNTTTATTVGAAGAAAALPANPLGYISANIGGTAVKIPYYNN